jgi:UDP-N-acetylglucosamine--N-acetylmuramyl-(pentapeptide) pyrophosphoryl-undecaprenol N-acetylglucosamine transferase
MATIILTGGGTAGHCTPHIALLPYIKRNFDKIYYIGSEHGIERTIIEKENIPYYFTPCVKLYRSITPKNLTIPFKLLLGISKAGKILDNLKPNIIFSKGGYVSLPTVIAAKARNIPVIAHESDYTLGLTNKICSKFCKIILTSFPETANQIKNGKFIGSPIRKPKIEINKKQALSYFGFNGSKPILLVTGGSQGSKIINDTIRADLISLTATYDIIHLCGKGNLIKKPPESGYFQAEFLNNIEYAFVCADVCVSRSGSNTLFELMYKRIPCVLIPLPKGVSRGDQILNAEYFTKLGLATMIEQKNLTPNSLSYAINSIYTNRFNIKRNFAKFPIEDASEKISNIITEYI